MAEGTRARMFAGCSWLKSKAGRAIFAGAAVLSVFILVPRRAAEPVHAVAAAATVEPMELMSVGPPGGTKLGISYYGMLAIPDDPRNDDLTKLSAKGFSLFRVWATWTGPNVSDGSLVRAGGRTDSAHRARLLDVLSKAKDKGWKIDITFDIQEFKRISGGGNPPYADYRTAVENVAKYVKGDPQSEDPTQKTDYSQYVVFDVCNEAINARKTLSDGSYEGTWFTLLSARKTRAGKTTWYELLQELIDIPRQYGIQSLFSVRGVGDPQDWSKGTKDQTFCEQAADYIDKVYLPSRYNQDPKPLVAPHFLRVPCPSAWGNRIQKRIRWMREKQSRLAGFYFYIQEENRRRDAGNCCDPVNCQEDNARADAAAGTGCPSNWLQPCGGNACEPMQNDFYNSATGAGNKGAWGWGFHTDAGLACDTVGKPRLMNNLDAVEKDVVDHVKSYL